MLQALISKRKTNKEESSFIQQESQDSLVIENDKTVQNNQTDYRFKTSSEALIRNDDDIDIINVENDERDITTDTLI